MAGAATTGMPNINQAAAQGIYGAGIGAAANLTNPLQRADIGAYQNPFTSQVIDATTADLERQRQMQQNVIGAQAQQAGAFGGTRQGVESALTNEAFARQLAQTSAGLRQQGFTQAQQAAQTDIQNRLNASNQLANISNLGFGMGQTITQNLARQGAQQQALQQALIDASKGQFAGYTGAPAASIQYVSNALGATPVPQTQTTSSQPGLFDYLTLAASGASAFSDVRLKEKIKRVGNLTPEIGLYQWEWNDEAKRIGVGDQPTVGVIAQEVKDKIPGAVLLGGDGYFRVNYDKIAEAVR